MRIVLSLPVVVSLLLAGCSGGDAQKEDEDPQGLVELEDGTRVAAGHGVLEGRVLSDRGLAVSGARVSVLGTDFFGDTGQTGAFRFVNISAGQHELSVQAQGFQAHRAPVTVEAGNITRVDVQLAPDRQAGAGYAPHSHDRWLGKDTYILMDGSVDLTQGSRGDGAYFIPWKGVVNSATNSTTWPIPIMDSPEDGPAIVLPGTAEMRVTFSSDDELVTQREWGILIFRTAGPHGSIQLPPKPLGETWTIPVNQTMADSGHQMFSLWDMRAYAGDDFQDAPDGDGGLAHGELDVHIELRKGDLYLEPVHEDFWQGKNELVVRSAEVGFETGTTGFYTPHRLALDDDRLVPPGANRMRITLDYEWNQGFPTAALPVEFMVKAASVNPQTWQYDDLPRPAPTEGSLAEGHAVWEFDLAEEDTDAFYQQRTNWEFFIKTEAHPLYHWEVRPGGISGTLEVVVFQE